MRFSTIASAALAGTLSVSAAPTRRQAAITDADILQYALTLEHLENHFYKQALSTMSEDMFLAANFSAEFYNELLFIAHDEEQHVLYLEAGLTAAGATPVKACTYNFGAAFDSSKSFIATAAVIEGVGVSAYLGAAPSIVDKSYLTAAGAILVTEALHQSQQRAAVGEVASPNVFGTPLGLNAVYTIASGFITGCPSDNVALPVKAYPTLTLGSGTPASTEGAILTLVPASEPSGTFFATFVSGLDIIAVAATYANNAVTVQVPAKVSGQSYVFLTSDNSSSVTDATVLAGPAIIEVTPASPTFDLTIQ